MLLCLVDEKMISLLPARFPSSLSRAIILPLLSSSSSDSARIRVRVSALPPSRTMSNSTGSPTAAAAAATGDPAASASSDDVIVQYVVLRRDLIDTWPLGSVVTQGCHASVAAVWTHRDCPDTAAYLSESNIESMHKVTLEVKGEAQMRNLAEKLEAEGIEHKLWIEQPENIPTCLATRPYPKSQVASFFKKLKLCK